MKKFLWKTLLYSLPILLPIAYYAIWISPHLHGDLGQLGQYPFPDNYTIESPKQAKEVHNITYNDTIPQNGVLIIGDSFSQPNGHSYTNYLASWSTKGIYNLCPDWSNSPFNRFLFIANQPLPPKIVIIESVERELLNRLSATIIAQSPQKMIQETIIEPVAVTHTRTSKVSEKPSLLQQTSMWIKRRVNYENPVKKTTLHTPMFSCDGHEKSLFFYQDDLNYSYDKETLALLTAKVDSLCAFAHENDIHLYLLIAEDKYDLYQPYIADSTHWEKTLLEDFCPLVQTRYLINSKDTLSKMAVNGVKDIYYCNDTHWSPIGAKAVATQVAKRIMELEEDTTLFHLPQ